MFNWTNEFGFIRNKDNEWIDAQGTCCSCNKHTHLAAIDDNGRVWCSNCIEQIINSATLSGSGKLFS